MAIDFQNEQLLSLTDAARAVPPIDGKRPHVSTIWRWCRKGVRGIQLEYVRLGHRVCTSERALARFSQRLAEADAEPRSHSPPSRATTPSECQQKKSHQRAEVELNRAGI